MSKHTPAPWKVAIDKTNVQIFSERFNEEGKELALPNIVCNYDINHYSGGNNRANARLIASAPDLLMVCREMIQCIADYNSGTDEEVSGWLYQWQKIVDKAEGVE